MPSDVLNVGDKVTVKVHRRQDGKVSLSMKALEEVKEEPEEKVVIPKSENIGPAWVIFSKTSSCKSVFVGSHCQSKTSENSEARYRRRIQHGCVGGFGSGAPWQQKLRNPGLC